MLFSEKSGVWSNGTAVFDLPMESASYLRLSISNLTLIRLGFLRVVFTGGGGGQFDPPPLIFQEELI